MTALDRFLNLFKQFGTVGALAATGATIAPIVAAASGLAPPVGDGLTFVTATLTFLTVAMIFMFLPRTRKGFARVFIGGTVAFTAALMTQVYLHMKFVVTVPTIEQPLVLGCGWRPLIAKLARTMDEIDASSQCPGDYLWLLASADNEPTQIWTASSISNIQTALVVTWVLIFVFFAVAVGAFVVFNSRRKERTARRTAT
jgi:ABC-type multidrug transport system permease subunit